MTQRAPDRRLTAWNEDSDREPEKHHVVPSAWSKETFGTQRAPEYGGSEEADRQG